MEDQGQLLGFLGTILGLVVIALGGWFRIEARVRRSDEDFRAAIAEFRAEIRAAIADVKSDAADRVGLAAAEASLARDHLAALKVHVAETYASKQGVSESVGRVLAEVQGLRSDLRGFAERLDRMMDQRAGVG